MGKSRRGGKMKSETAPKLNLDTVKFSFEHVDFKQSENFGLAKIVNQDFLENLFKELQHASITLPVPYRQQEGNHQNTWDDLTEDAFNHLPQELQDKKPHQIRVTPKARLHGLWEKNVFYIVWFDPDHLLNEYDIQERYKVRR